MEATFVQAGAATDVRWPDPVERPPAVREQWTGRPVPASHRSQATRSPAVSFTAKLWLRVLGIVYTGKEGWPVSSTFTPTNQRKCVTGHWGTLTSAIQASRKAAATAPGSFVRVSRLHCLLGYGRTRLPPLPAQEEESQLGGGGGEDGEKEGRRLRGRV